MRPSLLLLGVSLPTLLALGMVSGCVADRPPHVAGARPRAGFGDHYDYNGLVHLHTAYSGDATGTVEEITSLAGSVGMNFLVSTEHNNLDALTAGKEGWYGSTLFLTGVESSRQEGYLLNLGIERCSATRADSTADVLREVAEQDGLSLIAHPRNERWRWSAEIDSRIGGMEILDLMDQLRRASWRDIVAAAMWYPIDRASAYLQFLRRPVAELALWDAKSQERPFVGLYAPDWHGSLRLTSSMHLPIPHTAEMIGLVRDHILTRTPLTGDFVADKAQVVGALKSGHLYVALDVLADATGFRFEAQQGGRTAWMGDVLPSYEGARLAVTLPDAVSTHRPVIHILRNGVEVIRQPGMSATYSPREAGAYRAEVTLGGSLAPLSETTVTWLYANPIYLRAPAQPGTRLDQPAMLTLLGTLARYLH